MDRQAITLLLAERLLGLYGKETLSSILATAKAKPGVDRRAFRSAGNNQELMEAVPKALGIEPSLPDQFAAAIDEIEENGAQHIFLFKFAVGGKGGLTPKRFADLPELPRVISPALYSGIPSSPKLYRRQIGDELVLKQVRRATYEEFDHESPESGGRTMYYKTVETRAVNVLRLDFGSGEAEIRIDRARNRQDDELAIKLFRMFVGDLRPTFEALEYFEPIQLWSPATFSGILDAREETHMSTENALDASMRIRLASRREEDKGMDVRDHPSWVKKAARSSLRIYWNVPSEPRDKDGSKDGGASPQRLHTVISSVEFSDGDNNGGGAVVRKRIGKVYVAARTTPKKLEHVITRIRHFTR